ncbi:MAG: zinc-finger-containing protein [Geminicoccaceae bacterium]
MTRRSLPTGPATCLHCDGNCRLTTGAEIYPPRSDLHHKHFYVCDACDARVGCHPDTTKPLGHAADEPTRNARSKLHDLKLDPIWKNEPDKPSQKATRRRVYKFLAFALDIAPEYCHTGMFTIERCRAAWTALRGVTAQSLEDWCAARKETAQEHRSDRKRRRHGKPKRKESLQTGRVITGAQFCPKQAAINEVPW